MFRSAVILGPACGALVALAPPAPGQTFIRLTDSQTIPGPPTQAPRPGESGIAAPRGLESQCSCEPIDFLLAARARHAQAVPGGGTLSPGAVLNPATINAAGRIAFVASISGVARNQGIFTADASGLTVIARGGGGGGGSGNPGTGCGDPTPIGGTFSGSFQGTPFAPPINDRGDVLFLSDVNAGSSPRALFLFLADTLQFVKVAAVGDPYPGGGTIDAVGPGSLNDSRRVAFIARHSSTGNVNILTGKPAPSPASPPSAIPPPASARSLSSPASPSGTPMAPPSPPAPSPASTSPARSASAPSSPAARPSAASSSPPAASTNGPSAPATPRPPAARTSASSRPDQRCRRPRLLRRHP